MIEIILAALGAVMVALLFRRVMQIERRQAENSRQLDDATRQITQVRVEIASELMRLTSHANGIGREGDDPPGQAAVVNGNESQPPPGPEPARRKKHLGLFIGGAVAAMGAALSQTAREAWQAHRGQVVGAAVGTAVATSTVTMLTLTPWDTRINGEPPSSAPTAGPTDPVPPVPPPSYTYPPQPPTGSQAPSASPSPTASQPEPSGSPSPAPSESAPAPSPQPTGTLVPVDNDAEEPPPAEGTTPGGSEPPPPEPASPAPPAEPPPPRSPAQPEPPAEPAPPAGEEESPPASAYCASVALAPVADVNACLIQGGAGG